MAADRITIDLDLNSKRAQREVAKLQRQIDALGKSMGGAFKGIGGGGSGDKVRALGTGLSKATVRADEFSKSLEASNARVIAFGASAGLIMQVDRALKAMVTSAMKVEKAMMDVNVVMNASVKTLEKFGRGMFEVAKSTAQSFDTVAEAATELARQGLGMEKTLQRTKDALILTRLTGMNAADSVKALTAAVNSFNKEGATSAKIVNTMAKVDAAYAVSSEDLAKAIGRVGASAQSAGVNMNELMAITTAVQQRTARGGAVIGNAFKTIFTRIQRSDVQKRLRDFGIAATDMQGRMLSGMKVLENMAAGFDNLTKAQQASLAENVAGVFQVNILKAALADLSQETSNYRGSLKAANSATDEAYKRNEQLNQTLDALASRTMANLTKAGAALGGGMFEPAIRKVLGTVNSTIEAFGKGGAAEGIGETLGKSLLAGVGSFISGPGLAIVITAFTKLALNLGKFAMTAMKDFMGLNAVVKQRAALEQMVIEKLKSEPHYVQQVINKEKTLVQVEREILAVMQLQTAERAQMQAIARPVSRAMYSRGARVAPSGHGAFGMGSRPGGAGGFIPNFASAGAERAAAAAGGYNAGAIRTIKQPGAGRVMYNSAETIKQFPGMSQAAIMPPKSSPAGAGYRAAFSAAHGFNPYAAAGFIPNFNPAASFRRSDKSHTYPVGKRGGIVNMDLTLPATQRDMGIITETGTDTTPIRFSQNVMNPKEGIPALSKLMSQWRGADGRKVGKASLRVTGIPVVPIFPISGQNDTGGGRGPASPGTYLQKSLDRYSQRLAKEMFGDSSGLRDFDVNALSKGTMGDIFEEGVRTAVGGARNDDRLAAFDYMGKNYANSKLIGFFNRQGRSANLTTKSKIEAKIGQEAAVSGNIPRKMINDPMVGYSKEEVLKLFKDEFSTLTSAKGKRGRMPMAARGFVPNFSALTDAVGRELSAGVPASAIRVGSSPALRSANNPGGVGIYNTIHEPGGLGQGINRARRAGVNPKSHGAARGFVPNFMLTNPNPHDPEGKAGKDMKEAGDDQLKAADKQERAANRLMMASMVFSMAAPGISAGMGATPSTQAGISAGANITSMALMGAAMVPVNPLLGAAGGAAVGGLMSIGDLGMAFGHEGRMADAEQIKNEAIAIAEGLDQVSMALSSLGDIDFQTVEQKLQKYNKIQQEILDVQKMLMAGGAATAPARKAFFESDILQKVRGGAPQDLTPADFKAVNEEVTRMKALAEANLGSGDPRQFVTRSRNFNTSLQSVRRLQHAVNNPHPSSKPEYQMTRLREEQTAAADMIVGEGGMFTSAVQAQMAKHAESKGGGPNAIDKYIKQMEAGDVIGAAKTIAPVLKASGKTIEADALLKMTRNTDFTTTSATRLQGMVKGSVVGAMSENPGMGVLQQLEYAREQNLMGVFHGAYRKKARVKETPRELATREEEERQFKLALGPQIESAARGGRRAGYTMSAALKANARGFNLRRAGRTNRIALNQAGPLFGNALIDANAAIQSEAIDDTYMKTVEDAQAARQGTITKSQSEARATYLSSLRKADMGTDERMVGAYGLSMLEKMSLGEKEAELRRLEASPARSKADDLSITYLNKVIKDETEAREKETETIKEGVKEAENQNIVLEQNTKSQKEILEASKKFYSGKYFDNLKTERSILAGRIEMQEELVKEGRLNIEVLEESKLRFEELNEELGKTSNRLGVLENTFDRLLTTGLTDKQRKDAVVDAQKALNNQIGGRMSGGAGAAGVVSKAQRAFNAGQITADELRSIKASARLNAPGATGNPMEAFRDQFLYGGRDHMLEFESGVVSVANTMKSSFADAFKSIASGAATGKEAIVAFADGILNSISDVSANMATNIMFSKIFPQNAQGGYIPRYQSGGLVTGGSGVRDDVPALMRGGEYVIRKSAVNKIGVGTLNALNGYQSGGSTGQGGDFSMMDAAKLYGVSAAASAASGYINRPAERDRIPQQNYGLGRSEHGYLGGADPDAGGTSSIRGGARSASVSLNKAFVYYRRDPVTGQLISERARPTEGRFERSSLISTMGLLREDDPQTARMFSKEEKMASYQDYLIEEKQRRSDVMKAHNRQKRGRLMSAYVNAAMLVGGQAMMGGAGDLQGSVYSRAQDARIAAGSGSWNVGGGMAQKVGNARGGAIPSFAGGGRVSPAMLMGGEYVMSPDAVRTYGVNFMSELNRGNVPGMANGGLVGGGAPAGGGISTNNVKININIDKSGNAEIGSSLESGQGDNADDRDINNEVENNKKMAEMLQGVVLKTITDQQRPGGLLQNAKP